jgi:hypothetical protein
MSLRDPAEDAGALGSIAKQAFYGSPRVNPMDEKRLASGRDGRAHRNPKRQRGNAVRLCFLLADASGSDVSQPTFVPGLDKAVRH